MSQGHSWYQCNREQFTQHAQQLSLKVLKPSRHPCLFMSVFACLFARNKLSTGHYSSSFPCAFPVHIWSKDMNEEGQINRFGRELNQIRTICVSGPPLRANNLDDAKYMSSKSETAVWISTIYLSGPSSCNQFPWPYPCLGRDKEDWFGTICISRPTSTNQFAKRYTCLERGKEDWISTIYINGPSSSSHFPWHYPCLGEREVSTICVRDPLPSANFQSCILPNW